MSAIAVVGDSFCAAYGVEDWRSHGCTLNQWGTTEPTWVDQIARTGGYTLYPYGFGGKSWWFSRQRFSEALQRIPPDIFEHQLECIVFCHTNSGRINNAWNAELSNTDTHTPAAQNFYRYIFDSEFHAWAQQAWFREIAQRWAHLKTIHFHCFPDSVAYSDLLPGVVYTTPLIHISIGELTGSDADIQQQMIQDQRFNHLNAHNNQQLATVIQQALYNYQPGQYSINTQEFVQVNPNSVKFPHPGFGTK